MRNVRKLLRESRANILFIQETKSQTWSDKRLDPNWDSRNHGWLAVNSNGNAGGLLISWDKQFISISQVECSQQWLWCKG